MMKRVGHTWTRCFLYGGLFLLAILGCSHAEDDLNSPDDSENNQGLELDLIKNDMLIGGNVSLSNKISVIGEDKEMRSGILSIAERMRQELYEICNKVYEGPILPIVVELHGKKGDQAKPISMRVSIQQLYAEYRCRLDIHLARGLDHEKLQYHLMELFLYERGLSAGQRLGDGERALVKPWLIVGMLEALKIKKGAHDKYIYQADIDFFKVIPLPKVLSLTEKQMGNLVGQESLAFRAIAGSLVNSLFRQRNGRPNMEAYMAEFATFKGEAESLMRKHFSGMNTSRNSLEKWVNLELLELGTAEVTQRLSISETDARLESLLLLRYTDEEDIKNIKIDAYNEVLILDLAQRDFATAGAILELQRLSYRAFPEYLPLILEYLQILGEITTGSDKGIQTRLDNLMDTRQLMRDTDKRVTDYLNWFYITQSNQVSGDFKQYREISDQLRDESMRPPVDDHLKRYLDHVQEIYVGK
ncbi:MAG: hypothetical protein ACSHX0_05120 [Akkermansiaceae bacterium]